MRLYCVHSTKRKKKNQVLIFVAEVFTLLEVFLMLAAPRSRAMKHIQLLEALLMLLAVEEMLVACRQYEAAAEKTVEAVTLTAFLQKRHDKKVS